MQQFCNVLKRNCQAVRCHYRSRPSLSLFDIMTFHYRGISSTLESLKLQLTTTMLHNNYGRPTHESHTHRIIFPYLSDRMKRSRTFFILSPRVLKFCMITPTHILNKIGGGQNLSQKVKYFSILIFVWKMVKSGKFWTKNGIPAFLAHNRR